MAKLGKREMIILGVMAIAILCAAFVYLSPKEKNPGADMSQKTAELNTFVTGLEGSLKMDTMKNPGTLILSRAEKEWTQDPFLKGKDFKKWTEAITIKAGAEGSAVAKIEFVYSGYLEVGRNRMAIINGLEYKEGEALDVKGYMLKSISPANVVIENRGIGATINVPLLE